MTAVSMIRTGGCVRGAKAGKVGGAVACVAVVSQQGSPPRNGTEEARRPPEIFPAAPGRGA
jgi:hypothetical protein